MTAKNRHTVFTFKYNIYNNRGAGHYADPPVCPILYRSELCNDFHRAVVIAMIAVLVMQTAVDQIIDMVAVRNGLMTATFPMNMARTGIKRNAGIRVGFIYRQGVFVVMAVVLVVQMAVVQIVDMAVMFDGGMTAAAAVNMGVVVMNGAVCHDASFDSIKVGQVLPGFRETR